MLGSTAIPVRRNVSSALDVRIGIALHYLAESLGLPLTRIGRIAEGQGVHVGGDVADGGYQHFARRRKTPGMARRYRIGCLTQAAAPCPG
ncbi:hypothetical protein [Stenotrophomonas maltophilia]|uniref:hypothetical protein n=1 Tax=Stenotrophomonas maltophilia TaxID=40324 RepID=UPI0028950F15|nr:hypothetical protein [Stenotrophomonas maltophilia]MDT3501575.1 hypothetical protein [Stenotrophomonas maltophilia]